MTIMSVKETKEPRRKKIKHQNDSVSVTISREITV